MSTKNYKNRGLLKQIAMSYCHANKQDHTGLMASRILHGAYQTISEIYGIYSSDAVFLSLLIKRTNRIVF